MTNVKKLVTFDANENISQSTQLFLWSIVNKISVEKDYLQIFKLSREKGQQKVIHKQEVPLYEHVYFFDTNEPIEATVYIVIEENCSTMMLAENY